MLPSLHNETEVRARCPDCQAVTVFHIRGGDSREFGHAIVNKIQQHGPASYQRALYRLVVCGGCGRGGVAKILDQGGANPPALVDFYPHARESARLPDAVPAGVAAEYREAELCQSVGAHRAASALVRSVLEKALRANGYTKGLLAQKINEAAADGAITASRRQRAHDDIRVLGNEVVHDDWRAVTSDEVQTALHYSQRVLEDLYDDRATVEALLRSKQRIT
jgi:hypothetical protein